MNETMKLLGSTKIKLTSEKNVENMPHLEITEIILVHCNIVNNVSNKSFGQLVDISPKKFIFLKTFHSEFPYN